MKSLAIVIIGLPPSIESVYSAWAEKSPGWFDELRSSGRVTCNQSGTELAERGIDLPRLCELLEVEDDAAGFTTGLRTNLDDSLAAIEAGKLEIAEFNGALENIAESHEEHQLHPDLLDRIMHRHGECDCHVAAA